MLRFVLKFCQIYVIFKYFQEVEIIPFLIKNIGYNFFRCFLIFLFIILISNFQDMYINILKLKLYFKKFIHRFFLNVRFMIKIMVTTTCVCVIKIAPLIYDKIFVKYEFCHF
jgi:hypothetical protein